MNITQCDHFSLDRFTIQNYRIDYKIKIDNSGIDILAPKQYRGGQHMIAIMFIMGTKYDCNLSNKEGQI